MEPSILQRLPHHAGPNRTSLPKRLPFKRKLLVMTPDSPKMQPVPSQAHESTSNRNPQALIAAPTSWRKPTAKWIQARQPLHTANVRRNPSTGSTSGSIMNFIRPKKPARSKPGDRGPLSRYACIRRLEPFQIAHHLMMARKNHSHHALVGPAFCFPFR